MPTMQSRVRIAWREETGCIGESLAQRRLAAGCTRTPGRALPDAPTGFRKLAASRRCARFERLGPPKLNGLLEGFCPEPRLEEQIAVNSNGLILFLRLADIEWVEAADNGVELHVGPETHRLRDSLAAVGAKLPPDRFLRISRSTLVNREQIKELLPTFRGEYVVLLRNGTRLALTRGYFAKLRQTAGPHP